MYRNSEFGGFADGEPDASWLEYKLGYNEYVIQKNKNGDILIIGESLAHENDIKKRIYNIDKNAELVPDHSLKEAVDLRYVFEEFDITPKKISEYIKKGRLDGEKIRKSITKYYLNKSYSDGRKKNNICVH